MSGGRCDFEKVIRLGGSGISVRIAGVCCEVLAVGVFYGVLRYVVVSLLSASWKPSNIYLLCAHEQ